jgi:hypothetical protein
VIDINSELLNNIKDQLVTQVIPGVSLLTGWLLARLTDRVREKRKIRKLCKLTESELYQLKDELNSLLCKLERGIQISAKEGIEPAIHLPIEAHIYSNYYKDAVIGFNKAQRVSIQTIHTSIRYINSSSDKIEEIINKTHECDSEESFLSAQQQWKELIVGCYHNTANAIWHIRYHLDHPKNPNLSPGTEAHKNYLKYNKQVRDHVANVIKMARDIPLEKFEEIYDEASFSKAFSK